MLALLLLMFWFIDKGRYGKRCDVDAGNLDRARVDPFGEEWLGPIDRGDGELREALVWGFGRRRNLNAYRL